MQILPFLPIWQLWRDKFPLKDFIVGARKFRPSPELPLALWDF
jgi:hypothetical protein